MSRQVTLFYYASMADKAQKEQEKRQLAEGDDLSAVYHQLQRQYGFDKQPDQLRVAINDEFVTWDTVINDQDRIVFIPPVAAG